MYSGIPGGGELAPSGLPPRMPHPTWRGWPHTDAVTHTPEAFWGPKRLHMASPALRRPSGSCPPAPLLQRRRRAAPERNWCWGCNQKGEEDFAAPPFLVGHLPLTPLKLCHCICITVSIVVMQINTWQDLYFYFTMIPVERPFACSRWRNNGDSSSFTLMYVCKGWTKIIISFSVHTKCQMVSPLWLPCHHTNIFLSLALHCLFFILVLILTHSNSHFIPSVEATHLMLSMVQCYGHFLSISLGPVQPHLIKRVSTEEWDQQKSTKVISQSQNNVNFPWIGGGGVSINKLLSKRI